MRRPLLIVAAAVALIAPACGDDADSGASSPSEVEANAREAASEIQDRASEGADRASELGSEARDRASELGSEARDRASEVASEAEDATEAAGERMSGTDMTQQSDQLVQELRQRGLNNVASFIEAVGLENLVQGESFTLLAPTDDAFLALDRELLAKVLADPKEGVTVLENHVLPERMDRAQLAAVSSVETTGGESLPVVVDGDKLTIGGATVTEADIDAGGGVVHIIDSVITAGA
jgi:uncharacterized surface protein with fasciclin (FAS1) repeats